MIGFIRAHGYDPGATQRPLAAGALTGVLACAPAGAVFLGSGSFATVADEVLHASRPLAAMLVAAAFTVGGLLYGAAFQRAANDRRAGWILGLAYGFVLWVAAPVTVLPLLSGSAMAAGPAAVGLLASFLVWGVAVGLAFPLIHKPLQAGLDGSRRGRLQFGPDVAARLKQRLTHRPL